jgi:hypothetical protein
LLSSARLTVRRAANAYASCRDAAVVGAVGWQGCLTRDQSIAFERNSDSGNKRGKQSDARGEGESYHDCDIRLNKRPVEFAIEQKEALATIAARDSKSTCGR